MDAQIETGPMLDKSVTEQRALFEEWIGAGQRIDSHSAIRPKQFAPPETQSLEVLGRVSLKKSNEDQSELPCNACHSLRKFKQNGYAVTCSDGWWYLIGPDCGSDQLKNLVQIAKNDFAKFRAEQLASGRLASFYKRYDEVCAYLESCKRPVETLLAWSKMLAEHDELRTPLEQCLRNSGQLSVTETVGDPNEFSGYFAERVQRNFGRPISGVEVSQVQCAAARRLKETSGLLSALDVSSKQDLAAAIELAESKGRLAALEKQVSGLADGVRQLDEMLASSKKFFSHSTLSQLNDWFLLERDGIYELTRLGELVKVSRLDTLALELDVGPIENHSRIEL